MAADCMQVSVICPVYNVAPGLLAAAVQSVMGQTGAGVHELLLVDDASTSADTVAALAEYTTCNQRISVVRAARNGGPAAARNLGIARATGDWIGFIDADDLWAQGKLARAEAFLSRSPDTVWFGAAASTLESDGLMRPGPPLSCLPPNADAANETVNLVTPALTRSLIMEGMHLGANLMHRSIVIAAGGFNARITYGEDWVLLSRISLIASMRYDPEIGYVLRRQQQSMMWSAGRLSARYASGQRVAYRDPVLRPFRREIRWELYKTYKDLAANNLLNHRRLAALWFAAQAFAVDPREVAEFLLLLRLMATRGGAKRRQGLQRYSTSEQIDLAQIQGSGR